MESGTLSGGGGRAATASSAFVCLFSANEILFLRQFKITHQPRKEGGEEDKNTIDGTSCASERGIRCFFAEYTGEKAFRFTQTTLTKEQAGPSVTNEED